VPYNPDVPNPGRGAGNLTFKVAEAPHPGEIVLEQSDASSSLGYYYSHGDIPPKLQQGSTTYSDFFDPSFIPLGSPFEVSAAGGVDIAAQTFAGGMTPSPFNITDPPDYSQTGTKVSKAQGLKVSWTPQPNALMQIFINAGLGALTSCLVEDTGSVTIPAEAVPFFGETTIQLRRQVVRYHQVPTQDGNKAHIYLIGRLARIQSFFIDY
jgi:hypothetical protein